MRRLLALASAGAVALAACGGGDEGSGDEDSPASADETAMVSVGETELGRVLVGPDGNTLYGFTLDSPARSNCDGSCAEAWPPLTVGPEWGVGPGVERSLLDTLPRSDGQVQLVAGDWPLYTFSGDFGPGDVNGQGSGEVWYAVGEDGELIREANPSESARDPYGY
jgi:predicted lipoprotein with Yx(FWY)xxD motif